MLRKIGLALVAAAALVVGSAGLSSEASAHGMHGGGHWHGGGGGWHGGGWHGGGWYGPRFFVGGPYYGYGGCYVRRLVPTPWGPRWRLVNRCY